VEEQVEIGNEVRVLAALLGEGALDRDTLTSSIKLTTTALTIATIASRETVEENTTSNGGGGDVYKIE
jgi:hypothetical protein